MLIVGLTDAEVINKKNNQAPMNKYTSLLINVDGSRTVQRTDANFTDCSSYYLFYFG
jgi:hypothetical protein